MAQITLYKNGKTKQISEEGAGYFIRTYGWSKTAPSTPSVPSASPSAPPQAPTAPPQTSSAPPQDTSHQEVWRDGKSTTVQGHEVADYLSKGYTSDYQAPVEAPPETPTTPTEISTDVLDTPVTTEDIQAQVSEPWQGLTDVFGEGWTPAPIFEQLGLLEQGIYGAVRIKGMNDVYTIGAGGRKETAESYLERFGTDSQEGIVGEISMEEAIKLGIIVGADSILEPIMPTDPYEIWEHFRDEGKAEVDTLRKSMLEATQTLIDTMMGYGETKAKEKEEEKERLGIDEKDKAITDAEKIHTDMMASYSELLLKNRGEKFMSRILGTESRIIAQRAIEMAPLSANILIAQNAYGRAKDLLDDWSDDYNESMTFQMQAAQMNINMLEGELNREQAENLAEAQIKFDMWQADYNRQLDTQEEVKKLMLMYPSAGVSIADSWEDAYKKISPYIQNEADFEQKMRNIELATAQKALDKPYYAPKSGKSGTSDDKIVGWSEEAEAAGVVDWTQKKLDWVMNSPTAPPEFEQMMSEEYQESRASWQKEWDEQRNPILDAYRDSWGDYTDAEMRKLRQAGLENASTAEKDKYLYDKSSGRTFNEPSEDDDG